MKAIGTATEIHGLAACLDTRRKGILDLPAEVARWVLSCRHAERAHYWRRPPGGHRRQLRNHVSQSRLGRGAELLASL